MKEKRTRLKEYCISMGNSTTGAVGFAAYVDAISKRDALKKMRERISYEGHQIASEAGLSVFVYLNPDAIKLSDIQLND